VTVHDLAAALPGIAAVRDRCRALALLDAILSPEWESRYHFFGAQGAPGDEVASMDNGSGDAYSIAFTAAGAFIRGFDHESPMSPAANHERLWPGLVDTVPAVFAAQVSEPSFGFEGHLEATVCLWREAGDDSWQAGAIDFPPGADPDGANWLFQLIVDPSGYAAWAADYFEREVDAAAVADILAGKPHTIELFRRLNAETSLADIADLQDYADLVER
jgi:hypothetical protein